MEENQKIDWSALEQYNTRMIEEGLHAPDRIYIDLDFIKDTQLSRVLLNSDLTKEKYEALLQKIPEYRERVLYTFDFGISPNIAMRDSVVFRMAPATEFLETWFPKYLMVNVNHSAVLGKRETIEVVINTFPLVLPKDDRAHLCTYLAKRFGISVTAISKDPKDLPYTFWKCFQDLFVYRPNKGFMDRDEIRLAFTEMKFDKCRLYVPRLADTKVTDDNFVGEAAYMSIMTTFQFLPAHLLSPVVEKSNG